MKICFICSEYPPGPHGGIGAITQIIGRELVRRGHEVRVIGPYQQSYPGPDYSTDQGVRVWKIRQSLGRFGWISTRVRVFRQVAAWARNGEIDILEAPEWSGQTAGWPTLPVPLVVRAHGSVSYLSREAGKRVHASTFWIERSALRRSDTWCAVSGYLGRQTRAAFGLNRDPDAIIYNGVRVPDQPPVERIKGRVVFAGTLTRNKGVVALLQAWLQVADRYPDATLHLYGKDGRADNGLSMTAFLQSLIPRQISHQVCFHGLVPREEVLNAYWSASVGVFPSYSEGFALAPLEAMARGCPVIFTSRTSGPELLRHEQEGLLVDPGCPEEIASAIMRLLTEPALAERLGGAGRKRVDEKFSLERVMDQNEEFYKECLSRWRGRTASGAAIHATDNVDSRVRQ
jgi:glycosyltransferase involved in cell wall biosynthesis